jgi:uncharacterized Tic20 family protein
MTAPMPGPQHGYQPYPTHPTPSSEERSMALLAHLSTLVAMVVSVGWLSFVGPLILWFIHKDKSAFVRQSAAGAFNFNLSMWVLSIIGWICIFTLILAIPGVILLAISAIGQIVFHIIGAVRANRGELYRYPMQFIRILS